MNSILKITHKLGRIVIRVFGFLIAILVIASTANLFIENFDRASIEVYAIVVTEALLCVLLGKYLLNWMNDNE